MEQRRTRNIKKRKNNRLKRIGAALLVIAILAVSIGWIIIRKTAVGGAVFSSKVDMPFYKEDTFLSNSKSIVYKKGGNIKALDNKGRETFSIGGVADNAQMRLSEDYVAYFGQNYYNVYRLKDGKHESQYETSDVIYDIRLGEGYVAMIKADASGNTYLILNSFTSGEKFSTPVNTTTLLDFGVISTSETMWTVSVDTRITTPLCVFTSYKSNTVSGIINIAEQMVEKVVVNSDMVYAVGTSNLVIYSLSGKKEATYLTYGWRITDWLFVGAKPYFVLVPRTDGPITSVRIRHSDSTEYTFTLQEECSEVIIGKERIYALNESNIFYTDLKGENIRKAETPFKIKWSTSVLGGSHIIADNGSGYSLLSLK